MPFCRGFALGPLLFWNRLKGLFITGLEIKSSAQSIQKEVSMVPCCENYTGRSCFSGDWRLCRKESSNSLRKQVAILCEFVGIRNFFFALMVWFLTFFFVQHCWTLSCLSGFYPFVNIYFPFFFVFISALHFCDGIEFKARISSQNG